MVADVKKHNRRGSILSSVALVAVNNKATVILTVASLMAAISVLVNIISYYDAAITEVGDTLIESVTEQVQLEVSKFFVPKFNIRSVLQFAISTGVFSTQEVWAHAINNNISFAMDEYATLMNPLFHADSDFLAAYAALDNQQVLKFSGEEPQYWKTEHRHYVNASYQERIGCKSLKTDLKRPSKCSPVPLKVKSYDPFQKGWYQDATLTNGDCMDRLTCPGAFTWEGPGFQTATSDGDTDRPVFNMIFRLNWPYATYPGVDTTGNHFSNHKVKFLISKLKNVVDAVNVGTKGDLVLANEKGEILAARSLKSTDIILADKDGEKYFKKISSMPTFNMVRAADLGKSKQVVVTGENLGKDKFVVVNPIAEVPGWSIVMYIEVDDFLPLSSYLVQIAGGLSILSISLTALRFAILVTSWAGNLYIKRRNEKRMSSANYAGKSEASVALKVQTGDESKAPSSPRSNAPSSPGNYIKVAANSKQEIPQNVV